MSVQSSRMCAHLRIPSTGNVDPDIDLDPAVYPDVISLSEVVESTEAVAFLWAVVE
jgi:hypothetical protein